MYQRILAVMSGHDVEDGAMLARLSALGEHCGSLRLLRPVRSPLSGMDYRFLTPELRHQVRHRALGRAREQLDMQASRLRGDGMDVSYDVLWLEDDATPMILEAAAQQDADLVMLLRSHAGATPPGDLRRFLRLNEQIPAWLVDTGRDSPTTVHAAIDTGSSGGENLQGAAIAHHAAGLARSIGLPLCVLTVVPQLDWLTQELGELMSEMTHTEDPRREARDIHQRHLAALTETLSLDNGLTIGHEILEGTPADALEWHMRAHPDGLLVMGRSAHHTGLASLWRTTTQEKILHRVAGDLLIVPC
ncbi:universal stress protein [Isoalcanivorax indicus]|uniref:universal stress protein n=1 Tax=Isoalcanivorax indicus TaxID=2202653 RepID=UPI000DBAAED9|nr:universal stress protein [Isoalcanivorax indicus]